MNVKLKRNVLWKALAFLIILVCVNSFNFKELKVSASSYTTNVFTTYTIIYDRTITNSFTTTAFATAPLNSSSTVTVTFPIQYTLATNVTCSYLLNSAASYNVTPCTSLNNQITISNIFSSGTVVSSFILLVGGVLNPYPAGKTSNFTGTIGIDVAVPNGVSSFVTITPATSICSFTFNPNLVYKTQDMIFTLTVTNQFPSSGTIQVQFPLTKLWSLELDSTRSLPISTSMVCGSQSSVIFNLFRMLTQQFNAQEPHLLL